MAAVTAGVIGALGSIGGSLLSTAGPGPEKYNFESGLQLESAYRPVDYSAGLQQLLGQASFGVGADPTQLAIDLLTRQIESAANPESARDFQKNAQAVQSLLMQQQLNPGDPKIQKQLDLYMKQMNKILGKRGLGAVGIDANGFNVTLADKGLQQVVDQARTQGAGIRQDRLTAEQNLAKLAADFPTATAAQLDALTQQVRESQLRELNKTYQTDSDRIMAEANLRGYNPAGILSDLGENRADAAFDTQFTAADRALQILTGRQQGALGSITGINAGLSPDRLLAIQGAIRGQQTPTTGQLAAAQLAATNNANALAQQNQGAVGSGVSSAFGSIADSILMASILGQNKAKTGPATGDIHSPTSVGIPEGFL